MRNGLNESRQTASSQDLCAKLAMFAWLVGSGAVDHVALDHRFMRSIYRHTNEGKNILIKGMRGYDEIEATKK